MSIAVCVIGGAVIASPTGADGLGSKGKPPPKRQILAKPDFAFQPEAR